MGENPSDSTVEIYNLLRKEVSRDFERVERKILKVVSGISNDVIRGTLEYVFRAGGKRIRPILTLLISREFGGADENVISACACVEILHTASLLLDDVIDNSEVRRGKKSANFVFGNRTAVLSASYLLGVLSWELAKIGDVNLIRSFSKTARMMSVGEVEEAKLSFERLACALDGNLKSVLAELKRDYFKVIRLKTASLFSLASSIPFILFGSDSRKKALSEKFGNYVGIAFQIKDDILDIVSDRTGKQNFKDLQEGKLTLPVIESESVCEVVKLLPENWKDAGHIVKKSSGPERAQKRADEYIKKAKRIIPQIVLNGKVRKSLEAFLNLVTQRQF